MARTVSRPKRPYLGSSEIDDVMRMNTELLAELWILRDRVTVLEHLLEQRKLLDRKELHDFVPSGELAAELEREREALVRRVAGAPLNTSFDLASLVKDAPIG
jgi:hypothetical protein